MVIRVTKFRSETKCNLTKSEWILLLRELGVKMTHIWDSIPFGVIIFSCVLEFSSSSEFQVPRPQLGPHFPFCHIEAVCSDYNPSDWTTLNEDGIVTIA